MVQQVEDGPVGTINRLQGSLRPRPGFVGEVRDIGVGVLQPGVGVSHMLITR